MSYIMSTSYKSFIKTETDSRSALKQTHRCAGGAFELTNLGLRHHCGLSVAERRERQSQLGFFIPLEIQQRPQLIVLFLWFLYKYADPTLAGAGSRTHRRCTPYAPTSTNRLWIRLAPTVTGALCHKCVSFSPLICHKKDEM